MTMPVLLSHNILGNEIFFGFVYVESEEKPSIYRNRCPAVNIIT